MRRTRINSTAGIARWATGSQAPMLLHYLLNTIDSACRPEAQSKPRPAIRLVDRKPEGNV